ncbi:MAG: phosphotransferase [Oscillatoria sp. PMC 1068.18]|nr:phosphotransferase [Oscillatoria sp. PMC 1076.18]MEC4991331.1 phosphotransferase [Oscillatoria sp. PMC 1068.18]
MTQDVFPVNYSTLECFELVTRVLPEYEIAEICTCQFWHRGLSDIYLVETQTNRYILRVSHHHWRSRCEIDFELELLDYLHQNHLPVAYPLHTTADKLAVEINAPEGKRYAALFPYAPGNVALGDLNQNQSFLLGETLAKLHQVTCNWRSRHQRDPLSLEYLLDDAEVAIAPFLRHRNEELTYIQQVISEIKHQLTNFPTEAPYWGTCWGDPHSGNAHFTSDGKITLFDFDQCGYGWRAFDIGKFLQVSIRTGMPKNVREAFLTGYQSIEPLSKPELNSLQAFTQTAHIWMWGINLNNAIRYDCCRLDESYFTQRLQQLKRFNSHDWQLF